MAGWLSEAERAHMLDAGSALSSTPEGAGGSLGVEGGRDSEKLEAARPLVRAKAAMLKLSPVLFSTTECKFHLFSDLCFVLLRGPWIFKDSFFGL